jgi:hypothetical protein
MGFQKRSAMSNNRPEVRELTSATSCQSYAPGHQVHWIQARVKREEPKVDVQIKILDLNRLEITASDFSKIYFHHDSELITRALDRAVGNHIQLAIKAKLLQIQTELPSEIHGGAYALFYLSPETLTPCWKHLKAIKLTPSE